MFKIIHTILAAIVEQGVARRTAFNPAVMEGDVTKPAQGLPPASVEGVFKIMQPILAAVEESVAKRTAFNPVAD